jgi:hypothetical protein
MMGIALLLGATSWESISALASAVLGASAAAATALFAARSSRIARDAVQRIRESSPDAAMSALDLNTLGDYVYGTLGTMPISEYAENPAARADVARALERIDRFVSEDEPLAIDERGEDAAARSLAQAHRALESGDTWQSLAQLRRAIEIELRSVAQRRGIEVPPRAGAGRMLTLLARAEALPNEAVGRLQYAIQVANSAVHGGDIPPDVAYEAFDSAEGALRVIRD